ncbi:MAG: alpha/beta hydrolase [Pseudolabrys sp.]|nr:alpha/beta hydrolase [Pseudolabrys sp.]
MQLVSIPANPVPDGAVVGAFKAGDGVGLRYARWAPPPGRKGTVCIFQGRAEFIEKYFETVRDLQARGFAVATLDWRGQGLSDRALTDKRKGHVKDFYEYGLDLDAFMEQVVLPDCPPPLFALGHSMGGAIVLRACHDGRRWFDRVVLSAPLIGLPKNKLTGVAGTTLTLMKLIGRGNAYVPSADSFVIGRDKFIGNVLTSDPVRFARTVAVMEAEPQLVIGAPTMNWANAAWRAMNELASPAFAGTLRQPILMVAAGHDEVVSTPAIETFARYLLAGSHVIVPGARHELLQEQDQYRNQFWAAFDAFVPGTPLY